jgi:2-(1,2-epoxy-1,2-dihydrophenyl)acetyl-CoA isomerase
MTNVLETTTDDHLRVLRLNRPERKNALTGELIGGIIGAVREAASDDDVWAVAITGNGDAFCSGLDLEAVGGDEDGDGDGDDGSGDDGDHFLLAMRYECEKPVLVGVNGVAVGMGVSLAMCADFRIAAPSARFHPGYVRLATSPDGGLTWTLPEAVGYERAMRFFLEARMVDATEAAGMGMVGEVAESDDTFAARFLEYGRMLAEVAPMAARHTKRMVTRIRRPQSLPAHLTEEIRLTVGAFSTEDSRAAMRAMVAREKPTFTGR